MRAAVTSIWPGTHRGNQRDEPAGAQNSYIHCTSKSMVAKVDIRTHPRYIEGVNNKEAIGAGDDELPAKQEIDSGPAVSTGHSTPVRATAV